MLLPEVAVLSKQQYLRVSHCKYININKKIKKSPLGLLTMVLLVHKKPPGFTQMNTISNICPAIFTNGV